MTESVAPTVVKVGSEFRVNTSTAGNQVSSSITGLVGGGFVVTWQDGSGTLGDSSCSSIKAQVYAADGKQVGTEFLVNSHTAGAQLEPTITALSNGGFVIAWQDESCTEGDIRARIYGPSGAAVGGEIKVNSTTCGSQTVPAITALANGGFAVTWTSTLLFGLSDVKAQVFNAGGGKVGSEFQVNSTGIVPLLTDQERQSITTLANGDIVVTWNDNRTGDWAVRGQVLHVNGSSVTKAGGEFSVDKTDGGTQDAPVVGLSNGNFVVAYENTKGEIKAQLFSATGNKIGSAFDVNTQKKLTQESPSITALENGGFVVTWTDENPLGDGSGSSVKAQVFDAGGRKIGGEFLVNTQPMNGQSQSSVAAVGDGFVVTWQDRSRAIGDTSGYGIAAQMFVVSSVPPAPAIVSVTDDVGSVIGPVVNGGVTNDKNPTVRIGTSSYSAGDVVRLYDGTTLLGSVTLTAANVTQGHVDIQTTTLLDATHTLTATVTNTAGLVSAASAAFTVTLDTVAPAVAITTAGELTNEATQTIAGTSGEPAGSTVTLYDNGSATALGTATVGIDGKWSTTVTLSGDGPHSIVAVDADAAGNTGTSGPLVFTLDTVAPAVAITTAGELTNEATQTIAGTSGDSAGSTVTLYDNGSATALGTATVGIDGTWSTTVTLSGDGPHSIVAVDADAAGNTGTSGPLVFTLDTVAPAVAITTAGGSVYEPTQTIAGTSDEPAGSTVTLYDNGSTTALGTATVGVNGTWSTTVTLSGDGPHNIVAVDADVAGNTGTSSSVVLTLDTRLPGPASAIYRVGSEILVNTATYGNQSTPTVALTGGGFMVTWQDWSGTGGDTSASIKAQMFDPEGTPVGTEFLVNTQMASDQHIPTITALTDGGFVVTWVDFSGTLGDASGGSIKAQVFDATGAKSGTEFLVNTYTNYDQFNSRVAALNDGGFVVTWEDYSGTLGDTSGSSIKARVFDKSGGSNEFLVNTPSTTGPKYNPSIAGLSNGGFVVTWEDWGGTPDHPGISVIKAQLFDATGTKVDDEFLVDSETTANQWLPSITVLTDGGFLVTWEDHNGTDGSGTSIMGQLFDATGTKVGSDFVVNTLTANDQWLPITALAGGGFVVTWQDWSGTLGDTSLSSIKAQVFDATGAKVGSEFLVNTQTAGSQWYPNVAGLGDGRFVVTWQDDSGTLGDASGSSIKAQVFTVTPTAVVGTSGLVAGTATIEAGSTLDINGNSSADVVFASGGGTLLDLGQSTSFFGTIAGFGGGDAIDLSDIAFDAGSMTLGYAGNGSGTGGTLTVSDGTHTAALALLGQYTAGSFALASDGYGGTLVTDPGMAITETLLARAA